MKNLNSVDKLLEYINLAAKPVVILSTGFFRKYSCPPGCGSCCKPITLNYIKSSDRWESFEVLYPELVDRFELIVVDGVEIYSDNQSDNKDRFCKYLNLEDGRCKIHDTTPFPCEFVLSKFIDNQSRNRSILTTTYYGRGWNFLRVDKVTRGAMCKVGGFSFTKLRKDIELLEELYIYSVLFKKESKLPYILEYMYTNIEEFKKGNIPKNNVIFNQENKI